MIMSNRSLERALIDQGIVPKHCRLLDVVIPAGGLPILRYETIVQHEDLGNLADAFAAAFKMGEAWRRAAAAPSSTPAPDDTKEG